MSKYNPILMTVLVLLLASSTMACDGLLPSLPSRVPSPAKPPTAAESPPPEKTPTASEATDEDKWNTVEIFSGDGTETTSLFHVSGSEWRIIWTIDAKYPEDTVFDLVIYRQDTPHGIWDRVSNSGSSGGDIVYYISNQMPYDEKKREFIIKVLARNLRHWTVAIQDNADKAHNSSVQITDIHYRGTVHPPNPEICVCLERVEPDEYVVIKNLGDCYQEMTDWVLKNVTKGYPAFTFPSGFISYPGQIIRVYTTYPFNPDEIIAPYGYAMYPFCFHYGPGNVWDNEKSNTAVLYNASGEEVSRRSYTVSNWKECCSR